MSAEPDYDYGEAAELADDSAFAVWCRDNDVDPDDDGAWSDFVVNRPCRCCP